MKHMRRATRRTARKLAASMVILFMLLSTVAPAILLAPNTAVADDAVAPVEEMTAEAVVEESEPVGEQAAPAEEPAPAEESADTPVIGEPVLAPIEELAEPAEPTAPTDPTETSVTEEEVLAETPEATEPTVPAEPTGTPEVTEPADESGSGDIPDEPTVEAEGEASTEKVEEPALVEGLSAPVSEDVLEAVDVTGSACLGDEGAVLGNASPAWDTDGDAAETVAPVTLGTEYVFPLDTDVRVTFTCLPKDTALRAPIRIHRVATDALRLPEGVYPAGDRAYDITTDMKNGTFEYTLTLPKGDHADAGISYIEKDLVDVVTRDIDADEVKKIGDVDQKSGTVEASGIDHFTLFIPTFNWHFPPLTGTVTVVKRLLPASDEGRFDLRIDGAVRADDVSDNGTTGAVTVPTGWHTVAETAGTGTSLADYDTTISCSNHAWSGGASIGVFVLPGQNIVCTVTNKREGSLTIVKDARPDGEKVFTFWKLGHPSFGLNDNGTDEDGYSDRKTFSGLRAGIPYVFGEVNPGSGWNLENISCTGGEDVWTSLSHRKAIVTLNPGENVVCTFTNVAPGKIIVRKETLPDGSGQSFDFELSAVSDDSEARMFQSEDAEEDESGSLESFSLADGQSYESGGLSSGRYAVSEEILPGWDLSGAVCDDGSAVDDISVESGETVTCTFTNVKRGTITVKKSLGFESDQTFVFDSSYAGQFILGPEQSLLVGSLLPGTHSIVEADLYGWEMTGFTCTDSLGGSTFSVSGSSATVNLAPGGSVLCVSSSKDTKRDDDPWGGDGNGGDGGTAASAPIVGAVSAATVSGAAGTAAPEEPGQSAPEEEVEGAETGLVEGVESCVGGWPLWAWILLLAAFGGLYNLKKISRSISVLRWGRVVQGGSLVAALVAWYVFDVCRDYWPEVPVAVALIAVVSLLYRGQGENPEA